MAVHEDIVGWITSQISHIGLSLDGATEYAHAAYTHQVPTYGAPAAGAADLSATLNFNGAANAGPVTHLVFKRAGAVWTIRPVAAPASFNSDGKIDVTSAQITSAFPA